MLRECEEAVGDDDLGPLFSLDGAVRILIDKRFGDLPGGEGKDDQA